MAEQMRELVARAAAIWGRARAVVALTGAGLSTGSGIPDFRSPRTGLWHGDDPMVVASLETFRYSPETFFAWVRPLAGQIQRAEPNAAHRALARLEAQGKLQTVITQNIDELHRRAGSQNVLELHGSLRSLTCVHCFQVWPAEGRLERFVAQGVLPRCPRCDGLLKPDVTRQAARECDLMLVAGSSLEVMPAAGLPLEAIQRGAQVIVVNRDPTYVDERASVVIQADVNDVLPDLAEVVGAADAAR